MRREALSLVFVMFAGTILMAACDKPTTPEMQKSAMPRTSGPSTQPSAIPSPPPPATASRSENKDGTPPVQGQVDSKEPPQRRDFQTK
jgi:hypothetical protein